MSASASAAVFLSYASQDAAAARRICDALRAAGLEVWFDQNELVGGDAWDRKIRGQIRDCTLFLPLISAHTQARLEGYFRLEWKLAEDRSHLMAKGKPFLVPVVLDATSERDAHVPDAFLAVQWTRLAAGETPPAFVAHVQRLLGNSVPEPTPSRPPRSGEVTASPPAPPVGRALRARRFGPGAIAAVVAALAITGYFLITRKASAPADPTAKRSPQPTPEKPTAPLAPNPSPAAPQAVANEKSLVVLPLENLSPDPNNAFFTEGMHAEIISTLSRIPDLKVISRDSAAALRTVEGSLAEKARRVGVANVITGSVRREGTRVVVALELRRARDEAVLWSQRYDKQLGEGVIALQSDVAEQVARALQAREAKGTFASAQFMTANPEAYDFFSKAVAVFNQGVATAPSGTRLRNYEQAIKLTEQALELDSRFMTAASFLSTIHVFASSNPATPSAALSQHASEARRWAELASRLAPGGAGDGALAYYLITIERDNTRGLQLIEGALRALPNEALYHNRRGIALMRMGRLEDALSAYHRASDLDPLNTSFKRNELQVLARLRRQLAYEQALKRFALSERDSQIVAEHRFMLTGALPAEPSGTVIQRIRWVTMSRRFEDALSMADQALGSPGEIDSRRFDLLAQRARLLALLGRHTESEAEGRNALVLAEQLGAGRSSDASTQEWNLARAYALTGQLSRALDAAKRYVAARSPQSQAMDYWGRQIDLASLQAQFSRAKECCELLATLLRVPSGLTVPMLRVDPTWDPVRDDPAFQALLADPKNSAPL